MNQENEPKQDDMPKFMEGAKITNAHGSTRYVYVVRRHIHTALIWTVYIFQLAMAMIVAYRSATSDNSFVMEYWAIVIGFLVSVLVISWVEENIIYKDDLDG